MNKYDNMVSTGNVEGNNAIQTGKEQHTKWHEWEKYPNIERYEEWFKILCRIVTPEEKILSREM
eukprot:2391562-Ditylum_brightwellii.AAC.1